MQKAKMLSAMALVVLVSSVVVSNAGAAQFTTPGSHTIVTGSQTSNIVLVTHMGKVECHEAFFMGTVAGAAVSSVTITPHYTNCTAFGFKATVTMNGCDYVIYASGTADLSCPAGKTVVIDTALNACTVIIKPQSGLSSITFSTHNSWTHALLAHLNITNISYEEQTNFACINPHKATTGGTMTGTITFNGESEKSAIPLPITHDA